MEELMSLNDIKKNADQIDAETIHLRLKNEVDSGQFECYMDAFINFIKEQNIDLNDIAMDMYMTPALKGIIYNEACKKNMLVEKPLKNDIEDFF